MKAIVFSTEPEENIEPIPYLPNLVYLHYRDIPDPPLPDSNWVRVKTIIGGICGSDLGFLQGKVFPSLAPFTSFPYVPGHEILGEIVEVGKKSRGLSVGQRVSIDPTLGCQERGFRPICPQCRQGQFSICERLGEHGTVAPGILIGGCRDTGGGWGEHFVAHHHQVLPLPETLPDDEASLLEPFAVCLRAVLNTPPRKRETTVVIGAGTIGLATIAALKAVEPSCRIAAVAKHPFQGRLAQKLGAEFVIDALQDNVFETVGELCGSKVYRLSGGGALLAGGVPTVYDTIASATTLNQSLRMIRGRGTLVILGLVGLPEGVDWSPIWAKEIAVKGTLCYGVEALHGKKTRTFARAIDLLAKGQTNLQSICPRKFSIANYRQALFEATNKKDTEVVKVSFAF